MRLDLCELSLPLLHPFTITRGSKTHARTVLLRLTHQGIAALGESSPTERYGEDPISVIAYFRDHHLRSDDPYALDSLLRDLPPAVRCALDIALHDFIGKDLQRPLWRLLGLDPRQTPTTSFTIGIDTIETMVRKLEEIREHPILKIKLGTGNEIEIIETIRSRYAGTLRIDANEGWDAQTSVRILREIERFDIEFCEQPIPAGAPEQLRFIRERTTIPIITDEDSRFASDLPKLAGCVDGINIKLVKCGGIRAALEMIHTARALGLKIMLGCMLESAILCTAAAHLSPLVDWADLDGPFLTASDPFSGITYDRGKIRLPDAPGLGVFERAAA
jgi:L-alanine-DL-glutamate epimerase-like enolase superfamily enzyme